MDITNKYSPTWGYYRWGHGCLLAWSHHGMPHFSNQRNSEVVHLFSQVLVQELGAGLKLCHALDYRGVLLIKFGVYYIGHEAARFAFVITEVEVPATYND